MKTLYNFVETNEKDYVFRKKKADESARVREAPEGVYRVQAGCHRNSIQRIGGYCEQDADSEAVFRKVAELVLATAERVHGAEQVALVQGRGIPDARRSVPRHCQTAECPCG